MNFRQVGLFFPLILIGISTSVTADITLQNGSVIHFSDGSILSTATGQGADGATGPQGPPGSDANVPAGHGGTGNTVTGTDSFVGGGNGNLVSDEYGSIGGGQNNQAGDNLGTTSDNAYATVAGGYSNRAYATGSTISGGSGNRAIGVYSVVAGGIGNTSWGDRAIISGGIDNDASGNSSVMLGGAVNLATGDGSVMVGGDSSEAEGSRSIVIGGSQNHAQGVLSIIIGGFNQFAADDFGTISGGYQNSVGYDDSDTTNQRYGTVSGGFQNFAWGEACSIGGGTQNYADLSHSTIAGGTSNIADGIGASVGAGSGNDAGGTYSTVAGGLDNVAEGDYSFASGRRAIVNAAHDGTFLFADQTDADFPSAAANEFAVRANGGVRFITDSGTGAGVGLDAGDTSWNVLSEKKSKENYTGIDAVAILEQVTRLAIERWNYTHQDDSIQHIGPYAEDFHAAFGLHGKFSGTISSQDLDGVALAAIQGLNEKLTQELASVRAEKQAEIDRLTAQFVALEQRLVSIEASMD